jgi:hypothetical protein
MWEIFLQGHILSGDALKPCTQQIWDSEDTLLEDEP